MSTFGTRFLKSGQNGSNLSMHLEGPRVADAREVFVVRHPLWGVIRCLLACRQGGGEHSFMSEVPL